MTTRHDGSNGAVLRYSYQPPILPPVSDVAHTDRDLTKAFYESPEDLRIPLETPRCELMELIACNTNSTCIFYYSAGCGKEVEVAWLMQA